MNMNGNELLWFCLGLPLGPVYWFGIGFMQSIAALTATGVPFTFLNYLGYLCVAVPLLILIAMMNRAAKLRRLLLGGFIFSTLVQPLLFLLWNGGL